MTSDEIDRLVVGDVILYGRRRTPRIVRGVNNPPKRSRSGYKVYSVDVAIKHCSWTCRPYTILGRYELRKLCEKTNLRVKLDKKIDELMDFEIHKNKKFAQFDCCDAKCLLG